MMFKPHDKENTEARITGARLPLYDRPQNDPMNEHDMLDVMPTSCDHIEVLAALSTNNVESNWGDIEQIKRCINDPQIKHIIIPLGPEHWRGIYLTKPVSNNESEAYKLDIFDSFGEDSAKTILPFINDILENCNILDKTTKVYNQLIIPNNNIYACGDFVCGYSHLKMRQFHAESTHYNNKLIAELKTGNESERLREAILTVIAQKENRYVLIDEQKPKKRTKAPFFPPVHQPKPQTLKKNTCNISLSPVNTNTAPTKEDAPPILNQSLHTDKKNFVKNINETLKHSSTTGKNNDSWAIKTTEISDNEVTITPVKNDIALTNLNLTASFTKKTVTGLLNKQALHDNFDQFIATLVEMHIQTNNGYIPKHKDEINLKLTPPDENLMKKLSQGIDNYLSWVHSAKPEAPTPSFRAP